MHSQESSRVELCRSRLSIHLPFISAVGTTLNVEFTDCGTAAVSSTHVYFDPKFVASLQDPELAYLYAHEVMHKALLHAWRREWRRADLWNVACDHVINLQLNALGNPMLRMPKVGLADERFVGMSEEAVYLKLLEEGGNASKTGFGLDLIEDDATLADMQVEMTNIATAAKMAGCGGALADLVLKRSAPPAVRWQDVLRNFFTSKIRSGASWRRPGRRSHAAGAYLPTLQSSTLGSIVIFGDVSGSMMQCVNKVMNEMQGIVDDAAPECTHIICGDTRVTLATTVMRGEPLQLKLRGGGGTDFRPLFNEVEKQGWAPECGVFLTDTEGRFPDAPPAYPVLWGVLDHRGDVHVPWGEVLRIDA